MSDDGDIFDLMPDGRITLRMGGTSYVLRSPKLGEYRHLKAHLTETAQRLAEISQEALNVKAEADQIEGEGEQAQELLQQLRDRLSQVEIEDATEDLMSKLVIDIIETLNGATVAVDDLAPWATQNVAVVRMFQHWRTVPLGPGR